MLVLVLVEGSAFQDLEPNLLSGWNWHVIPLPPSYLSLKFALEFDNQHPHPIPELSGLRE